MISNSSTNGSIIFFRQSISLKSFLSEKSIGYQLISGTTFFKEINCSFADKSTYSETVPKGYSTSKGLF